MEQCPHCGERVEPVDAYCFECGTALEASTEADGSRGPTPERERGRGQRQTSRRESGRGQQRPPGAQGRVREPGSVTSDESSQGGTESLTTLWVAAALSVVSVVENVAIIVFAGDIADFVETEGTSLVDNVSAGDIAVQGGIGLVIAFGAVALCAYYYRQGVLDRRFFWALVGVGIGGLLLGGGLSVVLLAAVGAYGLLVVLRGSETEPQPARGVERR